jgi:hypothetical protein
MDTSSIEAGNSQKSDINITNIGNEFDRYSIRIPSLKGFSDDSWQIRV